MNVIMKFGGTSVEGATAFQNAARIVSERRALGPVVVVSAMAGFTDALLGSVQQALTGETDEGARSLEKHFDRIRVAAESAAEGKYAILNEKD